VLVAVAFGLPEGASAAKDSLYRGPAPRPGPDILYAKPTKAPQLRNKGPWKARPILISGASAYRRGEFLYQDFIYDDNGARAPTADPSDPRTAYSFSLTNGTYTYPTDPSYRENAADLVELRVKPLRHATAFRITLNSLTDPDLVATTIAIGGSDSSEPRELPHGANATAPAARFLTVHGTEAELVGAATGKATEPDPRVRVNRRRNQIDVRVRKRAWNPARRSIRLAAGVGLWDEAAGEYLIPGSEADADSPGGAAGLSDPSAFFNVAFRFDEPWPHVFPPDEVFTNPAWWRDRAQGTALKTGDLGAFDAEVDFGKLRTKVRDDMSSLPGGVPTGGPMNRILSTRFRTGEGADWGAGCGNISDCLGHLRGRLQPYAIYVPEGPRPAGGYGLTVLAHSLDAGYNQFANSRNQSQLGDRGPGSIVITPAGRGPDSWYWGHGGADTFEVWADVARRYRLDPRWTAISGYSMGGYATFKFASQFPDLFARANPVVGPPGLGIWVPPADPVPGGVASNTNLMLASVRNVPFLIWNGTADELVPVAGATAQAQTFDDLGYRHVWDLFVTSDHFALAANDQYMPAADFLGTHRVRRNPFHVTYIVNPAMDFAELGTVADHAYWLSGLRLRDAGDGAMGTIDAVSRAFGETDPAPGATQHGIGTLNGGNFGSMPFSEQSKAWAPGGSAPKNDRLELTAENVGRVVVSVARARLSCHPQLDVETDGPLTVRLAGCGRKLSFD
jgi:hypothetical protein